MKRRRGALSQPGVSYTVGGGVATENSPGVFERCGVLKT